MLLLIAGALSLVDVWLFVPISVLSMQVLGAISARPAAFPPIGRRPSVALIMPAHNEESGIFATVRSVAAQLASGDRLIVVADNCTDNTSLLAAEAGAEVVSRASVDRVGKGYALDFGIRFLSDTGKRDVVIFLDADCVVDDGSIERLACAVGTTGRPVQAAYLMNRPATVGRRAAFAAFAWLVKDYVRPLGSLAFRLPCQLCGSGMALPWAVARDLDYATSALAEDLKLTADLALLRRFVLFEPSAIVRSDVAPNGIPTYTQRVRWEQGTLQIALSYAPRLTIAAVANRSFRMLWLALDISVPPLALLALLTAVSLCAGTILFVIAGVHLALVLSLIQCIAFASAILIAWARFAQKLLPLRWLLSAPLYAAAKLPMYVRMIFSKERTWRRAGRQPRQ